LDCHAIGTLTECLEHSRLQEHPGQYPLTRDMVSNLAADHEMVIRCLREDLETCENTYHDSGTRDFLSQLMIAHEKTAWMLCAFLQGEPV
jgi:starvation-inducible DNA-binding protein